LAACEHNYKVTTDQLPKDSLSNLLCGFYSALQGFEDFAGTFPPRQTLVAPEDAERLWTK